jgi:hypothetical protein
MAIIVQGGQFVQPAHSDISVSAVSPICEISELSQVSFSELGPMVIFEVIRGGQ